MDIPKEQDTGVKILEKYHAFFFRIDPRNLGLFRILLGILLIVNWFVRWPDIPVFYADTGIFPISSGLPRGGGTWHFCILDFVSSVPMMRVAFTFGLGAYIAFLLGWYTRWATLATMIFFAGVVNRNFLIAHGGDTVAISVLIWSCFLNLGQCYSIDAMLGRVPVPNGPTLAPFFLMAQVAVVYLSTAFAKFGDNWRDGTALYYAWNLENFSTGLGQWLVHVLPLYWIKFLTWTALVMEWTIPIFFFVPILQPHLRRVGIVLSILLMIPIWATMAVGDFPLILLVCSVLFLSSQDWALLEKRFPKLRSERASVSIPTELWKPREAFVIVIGAAFTLQCFNYNFTERLKMEPLWTPSYLRALVSVMQSRQNWKMFAANPMKSDGWYVFEGTTMSGQKVDPWRDGMLSYERPSFESEQRGRFWMKYYEKMWRPSNMAYRKYWAEYVVRNYNRDKTKSSRLKWLKIIYFEEYNHSPEESLHKTITSQIIYEADVSNISEEPGDEELPEF